MFADWIGICALEVIENFHVLLYSEQVEQNVVLRTYAQELPELFRLFEHVDAEHGSLALGRLV